MLAPPANRPASGNSRRQWLIAAGLAILTALGLYGLHLWRGQEFRWDLFARSFIDIDWRWMSAALVMMLATYGGRALRWRVLMRPVCPHPRLSRLFRATAIGFTAITLFGRPGEFVRPYLIARKEGVSVSSQMAVWFLERIWDLLLVLLLFGVALTQVNVDPNSVGTGLRWVLRTGGWVATILAVVCGGVLLVCQLMTNVAQQRISQALAALPDGLRLRLSQMLAAFLAGMGSTRSLAFTAEIFAYTLLEWVLIVAANQFFFASFAATRNLTLTDALVFVGFVSFGSAVQIPGIGGGFQIAAIVVLTEIFGMSFESAAGIALVIWISTYVVIVPAGLLLALQDGLRWSALRNLESEAKT